MDADKLRAKLRRATERRVQRIYRILGPLRYVGMVESFKEAAEHACDSDMKVRESALFILEMVWNKEPLTEVIFARVMLCDRSNRLRERALSWLGWRYSNTLDPNLSTLLARVCLDEFNPIALRLEAYWQFCGVRNLDISDEVGDQLERAKKRLPAGIEWKLLATFAAF